ncbi:MAG: phosphoribosylglycinamide synthetase C domain-containing protein, partial [Candidatus Omnitrophica bacterium]|nr:phosphoribosylglycinamide synthetase C domain-containing protein [Candidatus Omnitrophota bacterium]
GAHSPAHLGVRELEHKIMNEVLMPMIKGLAEDGIPYKGILYAGIMVTENGPKVLEFNVRLGDPETQAILPRLKSDLVELMERSIDGDLKKIKPVWYEKSAVCVVMASGGYPGNYEKGKEITGLDETEKLKDAIVFHAGTKRIADKYVTSGGRVLGVTGLGDDMESAISNTYKAVSGIKFENMHFRRDIGRKALKYSLNARLT